MRHFVLQAALCSSLLLTGCKGDPNTPEYWEKAMSKAKRTQERTQLLSELRKSSALKPALLPFLHAQLQNEKSPEVRGEIARILSDLKDPSSVQPLIDAIEWGHADTPTRGMNKEITYALARIGDRQAIPTLIKLVKNNDPYTKLAAIEALGSLGAKEAVEPLMALATDEAGEPFVSKKAIQALGDIGDPRAVPALVKMMFKERRGISFYMESSFALYQLGTPAADALVPVVTKQDKATWEWARENSILEPAIYAKSAQVLGDLNDKRAEKPLLSQLAFNSDFLDLKLFVRMKAADALGRLRSKDAVTPLAALLNEGEANARQEYARALVWIGGRDALPALLKSATQGSWDARETAIRAASLLGDDRELEAFAKLEQEEEARTTAECKEDPSYKGCDAPAELAKKHVATIGTHKKRLEAAKECKQDADCWVKKLDDAEAAVRERAGYEVGRSGKPQLVSKLLERMNEKNLDTRYAFIQATHWLVVDNKEAARQAFSNIAAIEKQIAEERGRTDFVKVNEDLRRLAVAVRRHGA